MQCEHCKKTNRPPKCPREAPEGPPGAPKASWTAYTAADCTLPPGTLGITLSAPAPAPGPGETTFTYYFLPLSLYLLASNMCPRTPLPFGVGGFERAAPSAADPEKNNNVALKFKLY